MDSLFDILLGKSLSSGGTSNYNALENKPSINSVTLTGNKSLSDLGIAAASDIPTVNNGTLNIQKNGTLVNTFKANQASDVTVNITVPTSAADVSALPSSTKYAASLSLTINSSTYVVTGQLKDQDGNNLGTAQTIDLPLETMVVGGSYDSDNKKIILTLKNGNTVDIPVADLVSGLQSELSASNKLNPAYIDYDSTHAAVTDAEKTTWSGKQDALTFDGTYSASTNKAATVSTVTNAINALDVTGASGISAAKTISAWSETDGKVSVSTQDIAITGTQAVLTGYQESTTAGQAVAATDNVNQAIGKVEKRVSDNENNILLKADTSDVNTATANLQSQIDEIITPVTQDAEVQNARVGVDGTTYTTLKQRLDAENKLLKNKENFQRYNAIPTGWTASAFINNSDTCLGKTIAQVTVSGAGYALSPTININPADTIYIRAIYTGKTTIYFLDANQLIVSYNNLTKNTNDVLGSTYGTYDALTVPAKCYYAVICSRATTAGLSPEKSVEDVAMLCINSPLPADFIPYNNRYLAESTTNGQWRGKKAACLGCSLTANGGWTDVVKARLGFAKMYNRGAGGTTLANFSGYGLQDYVGSENVYTDTQNYDETWQSVFVVDTETATRPYENRANAWYSSEMRINLLPTDADVVIVDLCTNDFYRTFNQSYISEETFTQDTTIKTPYQESTSAYAYNDYYYRDAFMLMVKRIQARCPKARIIVWGMLYNSTIKTEDGSLDYYYQLIDLTKEMCRKTGVYFIDTIAEMGVNVFNSLSIIQDGVHPYKPTYTNQIGKYRIAESIIRCLSNITPLV